MSLADELLADLEELGHEDVSVSAPADKRPRPSDTETERDDMDDFRMEIPRTDNLESIAVLWQSEQLERVMQQLSDLEGKEPEPLSGVTEEHPEYTLIVEGNQLAVELENEIMHIHKFIRDLYAPRFPELEQMITNPIDYVRAVQLIGNEKDLAKLDGQLKKFLQAATVMVVTVTAATAPGQQLSQDKLDKVMEASRVVLSLEECRQRITNYVSSRIQVFAPNLSAIVGTRTAAQLMGVAGGLLSLTRVASCNLPSLGASKRVLAGFSSANPAMRNGFIWGCELVQSVPAEFQRKVVSLVSAKIALAARVDAVHQSMDGSAGLKFRDEIDRKIEKLLEPPPTKDVKSHKVPLYVPKKKRGGKLARKRKEKQSMTELQKLQNRVGFNVAEDEVLVGDEFEGLGMLGQSGSGSVRAAAVDTKTKVKLKPSQKKASGPSATSGLASSLAFTPVQGIELVDPQRQKQQEEKLKELNSKWFAKGGFVSVKKNE